MPVKEAPKFPSSLLNRGVVRYKSKEKAEDAYTKEVEVECRRVLESSGAKDILDGLKAGIDSDLHPEIEYGEDEPGEFSLTLRWDRSRDRINDLTVTVLPVTETILVEGAGIVAVPKTLWRDLDGRSVIGTVIRHFFDNPRKDDL